MSARLALALRTLGREWRSGELGVLLLALTIAVAALTGVGFLVERIGTAVDLQASEVLAADIRLGSPAADRTEISRRSARRGLRTARSTELLSVVFNGEQSQLTNVRAVDAAIPCAARYASRTSPSQRARRPTGIPAPRRSLAGLETARRDRREAGLAALDRRSHVSRHARADLASRSGRNVRGSCAQPHHERGGSCRRPN